VNRPQASPPPSDDAIIGRAARWSLAGLASAAAIAGLVWWLATRTAEEAPTEAPDVLTPALPGQAAGALPPLGFTDITAEAGIGFRRESGAEGEKLLPETMGGGSAFFDVDNDGDEDLLLVNSTTWPWSRRPRAAARPTLALYRNDGRGRFDEMTAAAGLDVEMYGMGAAVGDVDNDGWVDLFVSGLGGSRLFRNRGGRFEDVTAAAGVGAGDEWSTCAAFVDVDRDGDLDLFVGNYVKWSREIDFEQGFQLVGLGRAYGPPKSFEGRQPYLYLNLGGFRFRESAESAGLHVRNPATGVPVGKSLGVAPADLDADGWIDLVVANDTVPNFVFRNLGQGRFEEIGASTGIAFDTAGNTRGAMGIDVADFRNDGALAYAIGNFANEMTALYVSQGAPDQFVDEANTAGVGGPSRLSLTFGVIFLDVDLDGRLDLLTANGHLEEDIAKVQERQTYEQPASLFWNRGDEAPTYALVPPELAGDLARPLVGRGAAYADIDGDGDLDVVLTQASGPPHLLRNDWPGPSRYVRVKLVGSADNRDAIGAWIEAEIGGRRLRRQVMPTRGYLSQSELPVTFGLAGHAPPASLRVLWPNGTEQIVTGVEANRPMLATQTR
jgi:hypothetical protein